ncbi:MAG: response regulator, partial [Nostoc sp.]
QILALAPTEKAYRILVVDDSKESRLLLVKILTPLGFEVREATDGIEAIANWESWQPHLILMDMRMPVMDGYEATRIIKAKQIGDREWGTCTEQLDRSDSELVELLTVRHCRSMGHRGNPVLGKLCVGEVPKVVATAPTALAQPCDFSGVTQDYSNTHTIIIALTASAFEEERQKILSIGCDDFIRK